MGGSFSTQPASAEQLDVPRSGTMADAGQSKAPSFGHPLDVHIPPSETHTPVVSPSQLRRGDAVYYVFSLSDHKVDGNPSSLGSSLPANILASAKAPPKGGVHLALDFDALSLDARARHVAIYVGTACVPCRRPLPMEAAECDQCGRKARRDLLVERMNETAMIIPPDCNGADDELCALEWVEQRKLAKGTQAGAVKKVAVLWSTFPSFLARASKLHMPVWRLDAPRGAKDIHPDERAARALYFLGKEEVGGMPYSLLANNCETFAAWCCWDVIESAQVQHALSTAYSGAMGLLGVGLAVIAASFIYGAVRSARSDPEPQPMEGRPRSRSRSQERRPWEFESSGAANAAMMMHGRPS
ncbi:hypothetical protein DFJ74DRAFT_675149 [Hyaloraphidium curvatum]|nr:hypothetical protein DFJ74DRAFT_675149 [Hyaloraphidium curvatum]